MSHASPSLSFPFVKFLRFPSRKDHFVPLPIRLNICEDWGAVLRCLFVMADDPTTAPIEVTDAEKFTMRRSHVNVSKDNAHGLSDMSGTPMKS